MSAVATAFDQPLAPTATAAASERRLMLAHLVAGFTALLIGASLGPLQALNYAGINTYDMLPLQSYYQGLTIHGVLNAYVFTYFVINGLLVYLPARELDLPINMTLWRSGFALMAAGAAFALIAMFDNSSSVLWTFYPPLKGSAFFYIGMMLLGVGSLFPLPILVELRRTWKRRFPHQVTPLVTYMSLITLLMWAIGGLGVGIELVALLVPWSLGATTTVDPIIARTLFWMTGHPIVYFWLMPAYVSWYALLPRQVGGKLVSDTMARITFVLLFVLSLPVGSHHQFEDPGFSPIWRGILTALTMSVALPSLITAFSIGLNLEYAGRLRGGRGLIGWFTALPWRDPSVAGQVLSALTFIVGGATGLVIGSWQLNNVVHNTIYLPGHFHLTVGSVTAMTFMAITFWMVPHLTGRRLLSPRVALAAVWLWFIGISMLAAGMLFGGLYGVPRRAWLSLLPRSEYDALYGAAHAPLALMGVGGAILWLAIVCFYVVFFGTIVFGRHQSTPEAIPFSIALGAPAPPMSDSGAARPVPWLERIWLITGVAVVTTLAAYIPIFWPFLAHPNAVTGWRVW
ncbi:cbb3-type cytochrome c oxidase subunit I [Phenylobacterium sp.]|jgi:cytochrome c oxidase subunit 1|uniref:cbb3-type cytochrome c oxidase subunit I n=1 Tax=Phenylobacterium sp. TaxID=1871053 RepID=UPI002E352E0E|nr:cbb3-type cytochrome c oxidase subunit I [Phenylobacterium sp.]HEX4710326.1 cbb3-type cytochrome c oxidase subunit I [Phenylobacterium sp.]